MPEFGPDEVLAEIEDADEFLREMRKHPGEEVHLDLLALAGLLPVIERRENAVDHVHRADLVGEAGARRHRRHVAAAGVGDKPGEALDQHVLAGAIDIRPLLAVARAGAVDDARVDRLEVLVAVAEARKHAGAKILHHHVGLFGHVHEDRRAPFGS